MVTDRWRRHGGGSADARAECAKQNPGQACPSCHSPMQAAPIRLRAGMAGAREAPVAGDNAGVLAQQKRRGRNFGGDQKIYTLHVGYCPKRQAPISEET